MSQEYVENQIFEKVDFSKTPLLKGDYENCTFVRCSFSHSDISIIRFSECVFDTCDMSLSKITETEFQEVQFINSRLLGLQFDTCSNFLCSMNFDGCVLDFASFQGLKIKNTTWKDCQLHEVNFTDTDLTGSVFLNCDFTRAIFEKTILEKSDFRTSNNFIIDPENNRIKKARFSSSEIQGLLYKYNIFID
ncbi:pentapeptide repeat-containing protein [Candidatus Gracilibacteria bacterium]|nr:pentapeptide repeat-containing protein [Candidatus Gracilibacteria bacterium]